MTFYRGKLGIAVAILLVIAILWAPSAYAKSTSLGSILSIVGIVVAVASCLAGCFGLPAVIAALAPAAIPLAIASATFTVFTGVTGGLCLSGTNSPAYTGCGGGGGGGGSGGGGGGAGSGSAASASGVGSIGTCVVGYYVCGNKTCVPVGKVCCADVGHADKYCPENYICQTDGTCKSGGSAASAPTSSFSASSGEKSAGSGGSLGVGVGNSITLSWTSTGATACEINQGVGGVNPSGSAAVSCKTAGEFKFDLRCAGQGGEVTKSIAVVCQSTPKVKEIKPE